MKILYSLDVNPEVQGEITILENLKSHGYEFTVIDWPKEIGIPYYSYPSLAEIRQRYENRDPHLMALYDKITRLSKTHDAFIVCQSNVYLPEFIESLTDVYTVYYSGDDPDSSEVCSRPFVRSYDHMFTAGVNYDENTKITEKFTEWGAKRADWWPLGFRYGDYNPNLTVEDIFHRERDIDLVFIGSLARRNRNRMNQLIKLKRAFPQMKMYSFDLNRMKYKIPINLYYTMKTRKWCWNGPLPQENLASLYQRVKIGINIHDTYGPSTRRTYQLPANGVMQACNCPEGINDVFEVGKEVLTYHSIDEAIHFIQYYLENDEERKKIAAEGYRRATRDYNRETTYLDALQKIEKGMA